MKKLVIFVAVRNAENAWDLFARSSLANEWVRIYLTNLATRDAVCRSADSRISALQSYAVLFLDEFNSIEDVVNSNGYGQDRSEIDEAWQSWRARSDRSLPVVPPAATPNWGNVYVLREHNVFRLSSAGDSIAVVPRLAGLYMEEVGAYEPFNSDPSATLLVLQGEGPGLSVSVLRPGATAFSTELGSRVIKLFLAQEKQAGPVNWADVFVHYRGDGYRLTRDGNSAELAFSGLTAQEMAMRDPFVSQSWCLLVSLELTERAMAWHTVANGHLLPRYQSFPTRLRQVFLNKEQKCQESVAEEPKKDEVKVPSCGFCSAEGPCPEHYPHCSDHGSAAEVHAERLARGGAVDCAESRAESLRFVEHARARLSASEAENIGFRTSSDKGARVAIKDTPQPSEEIPQAGSTPHYEWP